MCHRQVFSLSLPYPSPPHTHQAELAPEVVSKFYCFQGYLKIDSTFMHLTPSITAASPSPLHCFCLSPSLFLCPLLLQNWVGRGIIVPLLTCSIKINGCPQWREEEADEGRCSNPNHPPQLLSWEVSYLFFLCHHHDLQQW